MGLKTILFIAATAFNLFKIFIRWKLFLLLLLETMGKKDLLLLLFMVAVCFTFCCVSVMIGLLSDYVWLGWM
jgi:hypothetical protein